MQKTIIFLTRQRAQRFVTKWNNFSGRDSIIESGLYNVPVTVCDLDQEGQDWINSYIAIAK